MATDHIPMVSKLHPIFTFNFYIQYLSIWYSQHIPTSPCRPRPCQKSSWPKSTRFMRTNQLGGFGAEAMGNEPGLAAFLTFKQQKNVDFNWKACQFLENWAICHGKLDGAIEDGDLYSYSWDIFSGGYHVNCFPQLELFKWVDSPLATVKNGHPSMRIAVADPCRKDATCETAAGVSQSQSVLRQQGPKKKGGWKVVLGRGGNSDTQKSIILWFVCNYRTGSETLLICQWGISVCLKMGYIPNEIAI